MAMVKELKIVCKTCGEESPADDRIAFYGKHNCLGNCSKKEERFFVGLCGHCICKECYEQLKEEAYQASQKQNIPQCPQDYEKYRTTFSISHDWEVNVHNHFSVADSHTFLKSWDKELWECFWITNFYSCDNIWSLVYLDKEHDGVRRLRRCGKWVGTPPPPFIDREKTVLYIKKTNRFIAQ